MCTLLLEKMLEVETDIDGALERFSGDKQFYSELLAAFPADPTMGELENALQNMSWDAAFTAAHALKGLAGNLGLTPLYHSLAELVIIIRAARINEISSHFDDVKENYDAVIKMINQYADATKEKEL